LMNFLLLPIKLGRIERIFKSGTANFSRPDQALRCGVSDADEHASRRSNKPR
jgi:hypothetical protein